MDCQAVCDAAVCIVLTSDSLQQQEGPLEETRLFLQGLMNFRRTSTKCQGSQQRLLGIIQVAPPCGPPPLHTAPKGDSLAAADCPEKQCGVSADLAWRHCATTLSLWTYCSAQHLTFSLSASPGSLAGGGSNSR